MSLRLAHSGPGITGAVRPGRRIPSPPSHVTVRPAGQPSPLHPSLYDREADPDRPVLPLPVKLALSLLCQHAHNPLTVPRVRALEAVAVVHAWTSGMELDPTPPHGTPRGTR